MFEIVYKSISNMLELAELGIQLRAFHKTTELATEFPIPNSQFRPV